MLGGHGQRTQPATEVIKYSYHAVHRHSRTGGARRAAACVPEASRAWRGVRAEEGECRPAAEQRGNQPVTYASNRNAGTSLVFAGFPCSPRLANRSATPSQ